MNNLHNIIRQRGIVNKLRVAITITHIGDETAGNLTVAETFIHLKNPNDLNIIMHRKITGPEEGFIREKRKEENKKKKKTSFFKHRPFSILP